MCEFECLFVSVCAYVSLSVCVCVCVCVGERDCVAGYWKATGDRTKEE